MVSRPSIPDGANTPRSEESTLDGRSSEVGGGDHDKPQHRPTDDKPFQEQPIMTIVLLACTSLMAMFLIALDRTVITTAIPVITDEFNSLPDIGWYASAYLMTCGSFQLLFGKIYTMFSVKVVLLLSILLFEIGSAICGAAPNSIAFIIGRAVAGMGAAGILTGSVVTTTRIVTLKQQPFMSPLFGAVSGIAMVLGPLIGGALTSHSTWRWCFYLNLPIGGFVMIVRTFTLKVPNGKHFDLSWKEKLWQLDPFGALCLVPAMVCLILALQWGGQAYPWNSGRVIALLTVMAFLFASFVAIQIFFPKTAMVPPRLFKQRSVYAGLWQMFFVGAGMYVVLYYIPVWFQTIKGDSAVQAGVKLLPLMAALLVALALFGLIVRKIGYYTPVGILGAILMAVGTGLFTTFEVNTGHPKWIGYQVIFGLGMGFSMQAPSIAIRTVLPRVDVPVGMALIFFGQLLGGAIGVPIGTNVLNNQLLKRLAGIPGFDKSLVTAGGATGLIKALPAELKPTVLQAYNSALQDVFKVSVVLTSLAVLGAIGMEWKSTHRESNDGGKPKGNDEEKNAAGAKTSEGTT